MIGLCLVFVNNVFFSLNTIEVAPKKHVYTTTHNTNTMKYGLKNKLHKTYIHCYTHQYKYTKYGLGHKLHKVFYNNSVLIVSM